MKALNPILKMLFVALLIGWALGRPSPASGQSQYYNCNSAGMGSCMQSAQQWMVGCINGCPHQGSPEEYCYSFPNCYCQQLNCSNNIEICITEGICADYPSSGQNCVQTCTNQMDNLVNQCYANNCSLE
jgi:hypothetical protein